MRASLGPLTTASLVTVLLVVVIVLLHPALIRPGPHLPANGDETARAWLDGALFDQALRTSLEHYGSIPATHPFLNGGMMLGAHPADGSLSPLTLLLLRLDALYALRLKTLFALVCGAMGLFLLARRAGAGRAAALTASLVLPVSGFVSERMMIAPLDLQVLICAGGLAIVLYAPARVGPAFIAAFGVFLAAFQSGSLIFFAPIAFCLATLVRSYSDPSRLREAGSLLALTIGFSLLLTSLKSFGLVTLLSGDNLRAAAEGFLSQDITSFWSRAGALLALWSPKSAPWSAPLILLLAAWGAYREGPRPRVGLMALFFIVLSLVPPAVLGPDGGARAWMAIRPLSQPLSIAPVFALITLGALCALALEGISTWNKALGRGLMAAFVLALCLPFLASAPKIGLKTVIETGEEASLFAQLDLSIKPKGDSGSFFFVHARAQRMPPGPLNQHPVFFLRRGIGVVDALKTYEIKNRVVPRFKIRKSGNKSSKRVRKNRRFRGEAHVAHNRGEVVFLAEGANWIHAKVETKKAKARLVFNRNFDPNWRGKGLTTSSARGLLAVSLEGEGEHEIVLRYRPVKLLYGLAIVLCSLLLALVFAVHERRLGDGGRDLT